jgi:AcrR family transcriptional regulator
MHQRGRWDRKASAHTRAAACRRALVAGAAQALFELGRAVTVSDVVERARVGRNTFYVHFDDLSAVFAAAEAEAFAKISTALAPSPSARTPLERFRRVASEWLSIAATEPHLVSLVVRGDGAQRGPHVGLRRMIENALRAIASSARAAGVLGRPTDANRLRALTGSYVALAERIIEESRGIDQARLVEELVDFSLRALR